MAFTLNIIVYLAKFSWLDAKCIGQRHAETFSDMSVPPAAGPDRSRPPRRGGNVLSPPRRVAILILIGNLCHKRLAKGWLILLVYVDVIDVLLCESVHGVADLFFSVNSYPISKRSILLGPPSGKRFTLYTNFIFS